MYAAQIPNLIRRDFLIQTSAIGAATLLGLHHRPASGEPALETSKVRFVHTPAICMASQYLAEELLRLEGFTEIEYLPLGNRTVPTVLAEGAMSFCGMLSEASLAGSPRFSSFKNRQSVPWAISFLSLKGLLRPVAAFNLIRLR